MFVSKKEQQEVLLFSDLISEKRKKKHRRAWTDRRKNHKEVWITATILLLYAAAASWRRWRAGDRVGLTVDHRRRPLPTRSVFARFRFPTATSKLILRRRPNQRAHAHLPCLVWVMDPLANRGGKTKAKQRMDGAASATRRTRRQIATNEPRS
jgi:hypothetical protein